VPPSFNASPHKDDSHTWPGSSPLQGGPCLPRCAFRHLCMRRSLRNACASPSRGNRLNTLRKSNGSPSRGFRCAGACKSHTAPAVRVPARQDPDRPDWVSVAAAVSAASLCSMRCSSGRCKWHAFPMWCNGSRTSSTTASVLLIRGCVHRRSRCVRSIQSSRNGNRQS